MPPKSNKRPATRASAAKPKKARLSVPESETEQVKNIEQYRRPMKDAAVYYIDDFIGGGDTKLASDLYEKLLKIDGWYQPKLKMYGKEITQSRKIAAFATDPNLVVKYSGQIVDMQYRIPPVLKEIQDMVELRLGVTFNHCMANLYDDGKIYIGNHRDNKENRVIASVSFGAPRTFIMTYDKPSAARLARTGPSSTDSLDSEEKQKWTLANGSLVVMQGTTQQYWKHEIPKEPSVKDGRISLTFRQLVF